MSHSSESHGTHDLNTPSPASGELASLVERLNKGADSASWTEALDLLRLAASQLAAVADERDALVKQIERMEYSDGDAEHWRGLAERAVTERDALREAIATPEAVHLNMLRGGIPRLSIRNALHLHGADALAKWDRAETAERLLAEAREVIDCALDEYQQREGRIVDPNSPHWSVAARLTLSPGGSNGQG